VSDAHQDPWYNGPQRGYGRDEANSPGIALDAKAVQVFFKKKNNLEVEAHYPRVWYRSIITLVCTY
jgi:hypothetical protein